jgi:hypothetical protein
MLHSIRGRFLQAGAVAAASFLAFTAAPVQATPSSSSTSANAAATVQQRTRTTEQSDRRVCVRVSLSSSRLARRVCKTQAEWDREGGVPVND